MPKDFQDKLVQEGAEAGSHLIEQGINPVFTGDEQDAQAHLQARMQINTDNPLAVTMLPNAKGSFDVFELPNEAKVYNHAVELTIGHDQNGAPIKQTFAPGQISIARSLALETAAIVDFSKAATAARSKIDIANQTGVSEKNEAAANKANAAATAGPKVGNLLAGNLEDGTKIAGTEDELKAAGASGIVKLPADESKKVIVARQMIAPDGLFAHVAADIQALEAKGKIGTVASRWADFMAGKVGSEPDFQPLRTDMGLLSTALMQAHVGARGSEEMLRHFKELADYSISDSATLRRALAREWDYVREKSMTPRKKGGQ
jgi:hypothetical protein